MNLRSVRISEFDCFWYFWLLFFGGDSKDGNEDKDWHSTCLKYFKRVMM